MRGHTKVRRAGASNIEYWQVPEIAVAPFHPQNVRMIANDHPSASGLFKPKTASNCCAGLLQSGMFRFFSKNSRMLLGFPCFCQFIRKSLRFSKTRNFADRHYARIHRAAVRDVACHVQVALVL